jgi:hypothetical protein
MQRQAAAASRCSRSDRDPLPCSRKNTDPWHRDKQSEHTFGRRRDNESSAGFDRASFFAQRLSDLLDFEGYIQSSRNGPHFVQPLSARPSASRLAMITRRRNMSVTLTGALRQSDSHLRAFVCWRATSAISIAGPSLQTTWSANAGPMRKAGVSSNSPGSL